MSVFLVAGPGDAKTCALAGVAFSGREGAAAFVPLPEERTAAAAVLAELVPFWEHGGIVKVGHDLKRWITALRWHGVTVAGRLLDTRLAHQLVESDGAHDLALLCEHYLGYQLLTLDEVAEDLLKQGDFSAAALTEGGLPPAKLATWAGERADLTAALLEALQAEIDRFEERDLWEQVEVPLMPLLVEMEHTGVGVRVDALREYSRELEKEVVAHELELYRLADGAFNLNSPKQLGELLFEKLKISDKPKRTRTGQYMTTEQELTRLADRHADHPADPGVPRRAEAEVHLRGFPARRRDAADRAHPHHLQPTGRGHRAAQLGGPQPAEHPDPQRPRAGDPARLRGPGWAVAAGRRLLADRAAHHGGDHRGSGPGGGVRGRRRHPRRHLRARVRRAARRGDRRHAAARQDDQLRADVRHVRIRPRPAPEHRPRGGA